MKDEVVLWILDKIQ